MVNRAMLMLQGSCGARPGEVCICHEDDINGSRDPWVWRPHQHKMLWRGRRRMIPIGDSGQLACMPFLGRGFLFQTKRGRPFRVDHYHQMIDESCKRTRTPHFCPQSVRRFTANEADALGDIEMAQELLGHSETRTTEQYLRRPGNRAMTFARKRG
jgi:integrase